MLTLLAAFKVLLYRYSGQEDICVGTSVAGRPLQELERLIGFFVNTLALRDEVNGNMAFTELLRRSKKDNTGSLCPSRGIFYPKKVVESGGKGTCCGP